MTQERTHEGGSISGHGEPGQIGRPAARGARPERPGGGGAAIFILWLLLLVGLSWFAVEAYNYLIGWAEGLSAGDWGR